ncbi:hypothetical protein WR164_02920 [Philodulcilactobacillus myokoensis]|uniref:Uncharacterized protein n=1 Tax=Philodulcilactobacillus myokoensis TaxID=2929573 RepID=A0A9W6ESG6_9LACO|nr:hypothetical protein [Philodulcilactobacillus myokoensis]GLB46313.1 hypothetical protein WR164_02920 [Philodulcilactobacillus myokoensis]
MKHKKTLLQKCLSYLKDKINAAEKIDDVPSILPMALIVRNLSALKSDASSHQILSQLGISCYTWVHSANKVQQQVADAHPDLVTPSVNKNDIIPFAQDLIHHFNFKHVLVLEQKNGVAVATPPDEYKSDYQQFLKDEKIDGKVVMFL